MSHWIRLAALGAVGTACAAATAAPRPAETASGRSYVLADAAVRIKFDPARAVQLLPEGYHARIVRGAKAAPPDGTARAVTIPGVTVPEVQELSGRVRMQRGDTVIVAVTALRQLAGARSSSGWKAGTVEAEVAMGPGDELQVLSREPFVLTAGVLLAAVAGVLLLGFIAGGGG